MHSARGATLTELVAAMAISAIVLAVAAPSFSALAASQRLVATSNGLLAQIQASRFLAVHRNNRVTICGSLDGERCHGTPDWSSGTMTFVDTNRNGSRDAGETVDRVLPGGDLNGLIVKSSSGRPTLAFNPDGMTAAGNLTLRICAQDRQEWRQIVVNLAGRSRIRRPAEPPGCSP
jgi:type IV fimbrial biogenesis protein FimT